MAKDKNSFILYTGQKDVFEALTDEQAGKLIKHIFSYVCDENPELQDQLLNIAFMPIKQALKRDLKKWEVYVEKQSLNGKRGGRPKKPTDNQKTQPFLEKPKKADIVNVNVIANVNDNVNVNDLYNTENFENEIREILSEQTILDISRLHSLEKNKVEVLRENFILVFNDTPEDVLSKSTGQIRQHFKNWCKNNHYKFDLTAPTTKEEILKLEDVDKW